MNNDIQDILVTKEEIEVLCEKLAKQINEDYKNQEVIMLGLLKGCIPFYAKLISYIDLDMKMEFMDVSSYHGGTESTDEITIKQDITTDITDKTILIVEDIVDTGQTLAEVVKLLKKRNARSVEVVTLLNKQEGRKVTFDPKYIGKEIENQFVVGFGLDYDEKYRNLPYVGVLKKTVYTK